MSGNIILTENFANLSAFTVSGTANAVSNEAVITPGNAGLNASGIISATPFTGDGYAIFKIGYKPSTLTNCNYWLGLCFQGTMSYSNSVGLYISGNSGETYALDSGANVLDSAYSTIADWQELAIEILGNDYCRIYIDQDLVYTTYNIGSGNNVCGEDVYLACGCDKVNGTSGTLYLRQGSMVDNREMSIEKDQVEEDTVPIGDQAYELIGLSPSTGYDSRVRKAFGDANYGGVEYGPYTDEVTETTDGAGNWPPSSSAKYIWATNYNATSTAKHIWKTNR